MFLNFIILQRVCFPKTRITGFTTFFKIVLAKKRGKGFLSSFTVSYSKRADMFFLKVVQSVLS